MSLVLFALIGLICLGSALHQHDHLEGQKNLLHAEDITRMQWEYETKDALVEKRSMRGHEYESSVEHHQHVEAMTKLLFPHSINSDNPFVKKKGSLIKHPDSAQSQVDFNYEHEAENHRKLEVPCVICRDMSWCSALNGFQIQEVYLPFNLNDLGTCKVLDALGEKVALEVFGNGRTFRDTPQCKDIVMQYLCLFYGSDNDMYTNECLNQEDVSDSNPVNHKVAPRPPCRSFCVQVAEVCASDPKFMQLCYNIACPPMEDSCTPDPMVEGQVLAANIGCDMPYEINPYFKKNGASVQISSSIGMILLALLCSISVVLAH